MAPATIRMVLIEGENADGVTVDQDNFDLGLGNRQSTLSGPDQLIAAILGTRRKAPAEAGYQTEFDRGRPGPITAMLPRSLGPRWPPTRSRT